MGGGAGSLRCMVYLSATLHGMPYNNNTESVRRCADFQLSRCPTNVLHNSSILGYVMIPVNHTRAPRAFRCRNEFSGLFFSRTLPHHGSLADHPESSPYPSISQGPLYQADLSSTTSSAEPARALPSRVTTTNSPL